MVEMLETRKLDLIVDTLPIYSKKTVTKVTLSKLYNCFAYNKNIMKDVDVKKVNIMNYEGKLKRMGRTMGRRADYKKAIVTLTAGSKEIEFFQSL